MDDNTLEIVIKTIDIMQQQLLSYSENQEIIADDVRVSITHNDVTELLKILTEEL